MAANRIKAIRLIMPSQGDMEIITQADSYIDFKPVYYGNECIGPIVQVVEGTKKEDGTIVVDKVLSRARLTFKRNANGDIAVDAKKGSDEN